MEFKKKVQFLGHQLSASNLHCYDFLDLESNLPFSTFSLTENEQFKKYEPYHNYDASFSLILSKSSKGIGWKVKGV
jgi:hypothetical protein